VAQQANLSKELSMMFFSGVLFELKNEFCPKVG
jgi:hypothetical protein